MANWPFAIVLLASSLLWQDRTPVGINTPEFEAERRQANELFLAGKVLDALPLYEHLEKLDPNHAVFAERRAAGLIAKSATLTEKTAQQAVLHEAYSELLRAQALGDNSAYTINQIESMKALFSDAGKSASSENPANAQLLARAEGAFARSDYAAALQSYSAMAANDPKSYQAALFAGDTCFRMHDTAAAAQWFAKAIAIQPDTETAYRYWGDTLMAANQPAEARDKFIDGVLAQPYQRSSWSGLTQWCQRTHTALLPHWSSGLCM